MNPVPHVGPSRLGRAVLGFGAAPSLGGSVYVSKRAFGNGI